MYTYTGNMAFDFVTQVNIESTDGNDVADQTQLDIINFFKDLGKRGLFFSLGNKEFDGFSFTLVGDKDALITWNTEEGMEDDDVFLKNLKSFTNN